MQKTFILITIILIMCSFATADYNYSFYKQTYDKLEKPLLDFDHAFKVKELKFQSDTAIFNLKEGTVIPLEEVNGQRYAFYFKGKGSIRLEPPVKPEKYVLKRLAGDEVFNYEFEKAIFYLSPDLANTVFPMDSTFSVRKHMKDQKYIDNIFDLLIDYNYDIPSIIMAKLISSSESPFILAEFEKYKRYYFINDPTLTESICLYRHISGYSWFNTVTKFFPKEYYLTSDDPYYRDPIYSVIPTHYKMTSRIENNTDMYVDATVNLVCQRDSLYRIEFALNSNIIVDSVLNTDKDSLFFSKIKDESGVEVFLNKPLMVGDSTQLQFFMNSKHLIEKTHSGNFYINSPSGWYPGIGSSLKSTFELSFQSPSRFDFLSVGEKKIDSISGDYRYTEWVITEPVNQPAFNYGLFETLEVKEADLPKITVYKSESGHINRFFTPDMLKITASYITAAIQFCIHMYGPYPYDELVVTDFPAYHSASYPGMINLAWATFETDVSGKGFESDAYRTKMVSYQWWGNMVSWDSYHDWWIPSGLAEYSGAWYMQHADGNNKRFLDMLDAWHDDITNKGGIRSWSEGSDAGAVWLGYRLSSFKSQDYSNLVFSKGAYIIHMLRMMLYDYITKSDDAFISMMKDFLATYRGKEVHLSDFQKIVEKHFRMDMGWFFNQWVYGTGIPTYKFDYDVEEIDGQYRITVKTEQKDVSPEFKMVMPMMVEMENDTHTFFKFWVGGDSEDFVTPLLPDKPKKVLFNPYHSVLCHID